MKIEIGHLEIRAAYKILNKRPILFTLTTTWKKTQILKSKKYLANIINKSEDYPKEILAKRKELQVKLQEERKKGRNAYIKYDKLVVQENKTTKIQTRKRFNPTSGVGGSVEDIVNPHKVNKITNFMRKRSDSLNSLQMEKKIKESIQ
ncbi:unnamed protein product [Leptidea sinapis]|uniref:Uncharacterized protein n=1 Tax=Leptidea sinapis TaxID=189913 RepID=A0A5E4QIE8_9NEOP|nr:unnamed protein product [Leptidea sinapis]